MPQVNAPTKTHGFPLFLMLLGFSAFSMFVPAVLANVQNDHHVARSFFYGGVLGLILVSLVAVALNGRENRYLASGQLLSLFATFAILPVFLAIPFHDAMRTTSFSNALFEMVSSLTTTGATIFDDPTRLADALHLWRAQVGWMGGLLMWIAASAILAPLNLGGFEVTARAEPGRGVISNNQMSKADPNKRLIKITSVLFPIYAGLTMALWIMLLIGGDTPLVAICHAMSVMATSGISPVGGVQNGGSGVGGEAVMFLFMLFALSRLTFSTDTVTATDGALRRDPEFRIGIGLVICVPLILFARHWWGAFEVNDETTWLDSLLALWGSMFTVLSFLTTTGFQSSGWVDAQMWSGLETPGLILMGLALIGGGVATTAGGVKLLRVFALYQNGVREMERLVHPSSVSGVSPMGRRIQKDGAFIAWIFFMLFALSLALTTIVLTGLGVDFADAIVLSVASLSTTGPLIEVAAETPIRLADLDNGAKGVLCVAMVLGRLETLAIVALVTPDLWRS